MGKAKITIRDATFLRIRDAFDFCRVNEKDLTSSQLEFVKSLRRQYKERGELTEKQMQCLWDIMKYLKPNETLRVRVNY